MSGIKDIYRILFSGNSLKVKLLTNYPRIKYGKCHFYLKDNGQTKTEQHRCNLLCNLEMLFDQSLEWSLQFPFFRFSGKS